MKKIVILLLLLISSISVNAQLNFKIDSLFLSQVSVKFEPFVVVEGLNEGPILFFECTLENNTDSTIILHPLEAKIFVVFRYQNKEYNKEVNSFYPFFSNKTITIMPTQKVFMEFSSLLFLGTAIHNSTKGDYTRELLMVLPTLEVRYIDDLINITTREIMNVRLSDDAIQKVTKEN